MKRPVNVGASIRQRLLNEAKRRGASFDYVASLYARERFLARLEASPHRNRLILKGATVFALWLESHRTTRDLDFLGLGDFALEEATSVVREIAEVAMERATPARLLLERLEPPPASLEEQPGTRAAAG